MAHKLHSLLLMTDVRLFETACQRDTRSKLYIVEEG